MINKKKGFTLIELLVVVSIIGLLSTMAVVSLNGARKKARDAKRVSDLKQIGTLIEMRVANQGSGSYGGAFGACTVGASTTCLSTDYEGVDLTSIVDPSALPSDPICDGTPTGFCNYSISSSSISYYEVCGNLEDGAGNISAGPFKVSNGGMTSQGCSN